MKKSILFGALSVLLISGCHQSKESAVEMSTTSVEVVSEDAGSFAPVAMDLSMPKQPNRSENTDVQETAIEKKLTKEATLRWKTNDIQSTHTLIVNETNRLNGYISDDNLTAGDDMTTIRLEVHVPAEKFDSFMNKLDEDVAKFDEKNIKVLDVTEEYIDVSTRIKTKKELEQHYYELLKQTKNVEEVLKVEEQLNIVRTDIESAEGRMKYLNSRIAQSTFYISIYQSHATPVGFFGEIGSSFKEGWKSLLYFILNLIRMWALLLFIGVVIYFVLRRLRKRKAS